MLVTDEDFDAEIKLASEGRWEDLGLDPPPGAGEFVPVSVDEFMRGA